MTPEYRNSLEYWASSLSDEKFSEMLVDTRLSSDEFEILQFEDLRRKQN